MKGAPANRGPRWIKQRRDPGEARLGRFKLGAFPDTDMTVTGRQKDQER